MVICAGPTGAGKTTTLYATLLEINATGKNVTTVEDPVEYVFPGINQVQTNTKAGLTFATALKALLRQDPDMILVGEIRDADTARIAIQSALTGHFVLSSLHGTDAVAALHRLLDMGIEAFLVASSIVGVVSQRLLRKMCDNCQEPYTARRRGAGGVPPALRWQRQDARSTTAAGCSYCSGTGYRDRIGVYELLRDHPRDPSSDRRLGDHRGTSSSGSCSRNAHDAPRSNADGRRRRHHHPRSRPNPVRPLSTDRDPRYRRDTEPDMPKFAYAAIDTHGAPVEGVTKADTIGAARAILVEQNLFPTKIEERRGMLDFELTKEKVKKKELMHFTRQLAVFVKAGIPITDALVTIGDETEDVALRRALGKIIDDLRNGGLLSVAAAEPPRGVPRVLRRHPAGRRTDRSARRVAREPCRVPRT